MQNRFGIEVRTGRHVIANHPRGGLVSGTITKVARMPSYGWRCTIDGGVSVALDDVRTCTILGRLPVRDDVTECAYYRPPTAAEIRFGHGAVHYRDFPIEECCHVGTRFPKRWFVASDDGLRYYR